MGEVDVLSTIVTTEMSTIQQSVACLQERKEIDHLRYQMVDQIASITTVRSVPFRGDISGCGFSCVYTCFSLYNTHIFIHIYYIYNYIYIIFEKYKNAMEITECHRHVVFCRLHHQ